MDEYDFSIVRRIKDGMMEEYMKETMTEADKMFKEMGFGYKYISKNESDNQVPCYVYTYINDPAYDDCIEIFDDGSFKSNMIIKPTVHKAIIKKLEEITNTKK